MPSGGWRNLRVLVVDGIAASRRYFSELFKSFGVDCTVAANGEDARRMIETSGVYGLYIVDRLTPGMEGGDVVKQIRALDAGKHPVITVISAVEWARLDGLPENAGEDRYLLRPFFESEVIDCVNKRLGVASVQTEPPAGENAWDLTGCKILLAEDVEINREIVLALFEDTGAEIDCAENGLAAVRLFTENPEKYDLIFMDMQMPEMDGLEAARTIRAMPLPWAHSVPIVAMTANVFKEDIENCLAAGMNDHLGKPLDFDELMRKLQKYLRRSEIGGGQAGGKGSGTII